MTYNFEVVKYNYATCSMSATTLNNLIIGIICSVIAVAIIVYIAVIVYKKVRYNKLLKEAAKRSIKEEDLKLLEQKQEEFNLEDFMITNQEIPWED